MASVVSMAPSNITPRLVEPSYNLNHKSANNKLHPQKTLGILKISPKREGQLPIERLSNVEFPPLPTFNLEAPPVASDTWAMKVKRGSIPRKSLAQLKPAQAQNVRLQSKARTVNDAVRDDERSLVLSPRKDSQAQMGNPFSLLGVVLKEKLKYMIPSLKVHCIKAFIKIARGKYMFS